MFSNFMGAWKAHVFVNILLFLKALQYEDVSFKKSRWVLRRQSIQDCGRRARGQAKDMGLSNKAGCPLRASEPRKKEPPYWEPPIYTRIV